MPARRKIYYGGEKPVSDYGAPDDLAFLINCSVLNVGFFGLHLKT